MPKRYVTIVVPTTYWRPGHDYCTTICRLLLDELQDGDIVVLSEKAISVAEGRLIDEAKIRPKTTAKILCRFWMRFFWGYILAPICRLSKVGISRLRSYPVREGSAHKQLALSHGGFLQALRHGSEGGIDVSNLPYSYASLPLKNPKRISEKILQAIRKVNPVDIAVLIVDSDKTYTWRTVHISPRPSTLRGILYLNILAYLVGRVLRLRPRSTPIALTGKSLSTEEALRAAAVANRARGSGSGRTAWDMAERFGVSLTDVSWELLESIKHRPVVIVRKASNFKSRLEKIEKKYKADSPFLSD